VSGHLAVCHKVMAEPLLLNIERYTRLGFVSCLNINMFRSIVLGRNR